MEWNGFAIELMNNASHLLKKRHDKDLQKLDKEVQQQKTLEKIQKDIEEIKNISLDLQKKMEPKDSIKKD